MLLKNNQYDIFVQSIANIFPFDFSGNYQTQIGEQANEIIEVFKITNSTIKDMVFLVKGLEGIIGCFYEDCPIPKCLSRTLRFHVRMLGRLYRKMSKLDPEHLRNSHLKESHHWIAAMNPLQTSIEISFLFPTIYNMDALKYFSDLVQEDHLQIPHYLDYLERFISEVSLKKIDFLFGDPKLYDNEDQPHISENVEILSMYLSEDPSSRICGIVSFFKNICSSKKISNYVINTFLKHLSRSIMNGVAFNSIDMSLTCYLLLELLCLFLEVSFTKTTVFILKSSVLQQIIQLVEDESIQNKQVKLMLVKVCRMLLPKAGSVTLYAELSNYIINSGLVDYVWGVLLEFRRPKNLLFSAAASFFMDASALNSAYIIAYMVINNLTSRWTYTRECLHQSRTFLHFLEPIHTSTLQAYQR